MRVFDVSESQAAYDKFMEGQTRPGNRRGGARLYAADEAEVHELHDLVIETRP